MSNILIKYTCVNCDHGEVSKIEIIYSNHLYYLLLPIFLNTVDFCDHIGCQKSKTANEPTVVYHMVYVYNFTVCSLPIVLARSESEPGAPGH